MWRNWQPRKIQGLVAERSWRFDSSHPQCGRGVVVAQHVVVVLVAVRVRASTFS